MATSGVGDLDEKLRPFVLDNLHDMPKRNAELAAGSYGFVYEVKVKGIVRIAKKPHIAFLKRVSQAEKDHVITRFKEECLLLSKLRHPNIVRFIGVHYKKHSKDDIVLVMERLKYDLAEFLDANKNNVTLTRKIFILQDVSFGLLYLHENNQPIIHRDLTARNILLTSSLQAKIADVGVAKLIDPATMAAASYTVAPGQQNYMPPEALRENPKYSVKLDIFSFGHLSLYTVIEDFPKVYMITVTPSMQQDGITEKLKRQSSLDHVGENHDLYPIIIQCLHDDPERRPSSRELNDFMNVLADRRTSETDMAESTVEVALKGSQKVNESDQKSPEKREADGVQIDYIAKKVESIEIGKDQLPAHRFTQNWSKLSREDLIDRIKGMVFGQAIGDALGLATEFMTKGEAKKYYKKGLSYDVIVQDFHRSRWDRSDWTDDTDQMLLILLMIVEGNGAVDQLDFAKRLYNWMRRGFPEFGDFGGMGIEDAESTSQVLRHPNFRQHPAMAAQDVWERSGRCEATNGAIMRTSILGALSFNDISKVAENTVAIAEVTHADPRCKASCVATTVAIALMLQGKYSLDKKGVSEISQAAAKEACKLLENKVQRDEMAHHISSSLGGLKLNDRNTIGYTFKALGCGFYGLREGGHKDFKKIITSVVMEAGAADSNAAVCGAVLGCKMGYKNLPEDLLQMKHKKWLEEKMNAFLKVTGLID